MLLVITMGAWRGGHYTVFICIRPSYVCAVKLTSLFIHFELTIFRNGKSSKKSNILPEPGNLVTDSQNS